MRKPLVPKAQGTGKDERMTEAVMPDRPETFWQNQDDGGFPIAPWPETELTAHTLGADRLETSSDHLLSPGKVQIGGIARNVTVRPRFYYLLQLDYLEVRLERRDRAGNPLPLLQAVMEGPRIRGSCVDGEQIEVRGRLNKDGVVVAHRILNRRTGAVIKPVGLKVVAIPVAFFGVALLANLYGILTHTELDPMRHTLEYTCRLLAYLTGLGLALRFLLRT